MIDGVSAQGQPPNPDPAIDRSLHERTIGQGWLTALRRQRGILADLPAMIEQQLEFPNVHSPKSSGRRRRATETIHVMSLVELPDRIEKFGDVVVAHVIH